MHKGPYRAEGIYIKDSGGKSVLITPAQGDPSADFALAVALADRLNRADEMERQLAQADAVLFFNSGEETHKRLISKTPRHGERAIIDDFEAEAISRHLARAALPPTPESET